MKPDPINGEVEILIVEDSPTQAEKLKIILERHGYQNSAVRNGREALAAIARKAPTLVISDIMMPEMDGYELCHLIKQDEKLKTIPVILLTSLSDPTDVMKGLESGADSFVFKPYDDQYLLARVAYTLANRHLREGQYPQMGVEIFFTGRKFFITSDRLQILNLLLSTYEAAVQKNRDLAETQDELRHLNESLESKVKERTAALELEIAERKEIEVKLEAQLGRLNLLHQITRAIDERQDLRSIFQVVIRSLEDSLPIDFCCICLHDQQKRLLTVTSVGVQSGAFAVELAMTEQASIPVEENGLSRCVNGQLFYEPDIREARYPFSQRLAQSGFCSVVMAPLLVESQVFGVLLAARRQVRGFSSAECEFLRQLSGQVALAAHQAELYNSLQQAYDDLHRTQQAVMQQERLRALGQMASGIAHDINNAISPIALYTESLLEKEPNLSERGRDYLQTIQRAIDDVAATVSRMREFCRPRESSQVALAPVHLNDLLRQVTDLTRSRWKDLPQERGIVIDLQTEFMADLPSIMGVESEIRDALTNLVLNATDAMPKGGTLTLRTSVTEAPFGPGERSRLRRVQAEVADTGQGMSEEVRRRCLEPFFTTKGERGTGLGLAMVYGMVQRHNAGIEIEGAPGGGTVIRLVFPIPESTAITAASMPHAPAFTRCLRILMVDDDPLIIKSLSDALEGEGHHVVTADGGEAGINAFLAGLETGAPFEVVITDLGMPRVDGRGVAAKVKEASPSTPVIMLTGWGRRLLEEHETPPYVDRVLSKPPKLRELREAFAALLANSGQTAPP